MSEEFHVKIRWKIQRCAMAVTQSASNLMSIGEGISINLTFAETRCHLSADQ